MMARLLMQTLALARPASSPSTTAASASLRGLATKVEIIEIDLTEEDARSSPHDGSSPSSHDGSSPSSHDGSSPSSPSLEEVGLQRVEDAIHGVRVHRAAPYWLPFVPGASFWVPPLQRSHKEMEVMGQIVAVGGAAMIDKVVRLIAAEGGGDEGVAAGPVGGAVPVVELDAPPVAEDWALCFSSTRGWPSPSFFIKGKSPHSRRKSRKGATQTDDEES